MTEHESPAETSPAPASAKRPSGFTIKRAVVAVVSILVVLFAVVNRRQVEVSWIFGSPIQSPLILVIVVSVLAGLVIGYLFARFGGRGSSSQ